MNSRIDSDKSTGSSTAGEHYRDRLARMQGQSWKKLLRPLDPYRLHVQSLRMGDVLEIGCGVGRCLGFLKGKGIGVDHNPHSVQMCRNLGLPAFTTDEFKIDQWKGRFDSILASHLLEHMTVDESVALLQSYLPVLKPGGRVIVFTPQERGQASDSTHVQWVDFNVQKEIFDRLGLQQVRQYSFPFPRFMGRYWIYNEFVGIGVMN